MDLRAFIEAFRERGQNGALFPVALAVVLFIGVLPTVALMAAIAAVSLCLVGRICDRLNQAYRNWRESHNPTEQRMPLVIYRTKRRY